jgi:hypothetical protein
MKNGVPFNVVFPGVTELLPHEKLAMQVTLTEFNGSKFNWVTKEFEESKDGS